MRASIVSMLLAGSLLALGSGAAMAQSSTEAQGTANLHHRLNAAVDRSLNRTLPRPRASSAVRSCEDRATPAAAAARPALPQADTQCRRTLGYLRRESQRQHRNVAIDRSLNRGQ